MMAALKNKMQRMRLKAKSILASKSGDQMTGWLIVVLIVVVVVAVVRVVQDAFPPHWTVL